MANLILSLKVLFVVYCFNNFYFKNFQLVRDGQETSIGEAHLDGAHERRA